MIEAALNRLRGSGLKCFNNKILDTIITGANIYGLYIGVLMFAFSGVWYSIIIGFLVFKLGESFAWGKWVGTLVAEPKDINVERFKADKDGHSFPYINKVVELFVSEDNPVTFSYIALTIRGFYWWLPIFVAFAFFGLTTYFLAFLGAVVLGLCFPIACRLGYYTDFKKEIGVFTFSKGWENQEWYYGLFQGIVIWTLLLIGVPVV